MRIAPNIRKRNASGQLWCKGCKDYHDPGDFSPQHGFYQQSCKEFRNRKLREQRQRVIKCARCGKMFQCSHKKRLFCTMYCKTRANEKRWPVQPKVVICTCGAEFKASQPTAKYCSLQCYKTARSSGTSRQMRGMATKACLECGTSFTRPACRKQKFCSIACAYTHQRGPANHLWRGGRNEYLGNWNEQRKLIRQRDVSCRACGKSAVSNGTLLSVDHIIPLKLMNRFSLEPHNEVNLLALCSQCHGKKNRAERLLFKGDVLGFRSALAAMGYPMDAVAAASSFIGL